MLGVRRGSCTAGLTAADRGELWDQRLLQRSLERSAADDEPPHPLAFLVLGLVALEQTRAEDARRFSEEALAVARARGSVRACGSALWRREDAFV